MRPFSLVVAATAMSALFVELLCACTMPLPNDAEIGCAYDPQSSPKCPGFDAGVAVPDASGSATRPEGGEAGEAQDAPSDAPAEGAAVASGLGKACGAPSDCAGQPANYCLVSPNGAFASFCTFTHCTALECGATYACCDCTTSPVAQVNTLPAGICVLPMTAKALPAYGCTCSPN